MFQIYNELFFDEKIKSSKKSTKSKKDKKEDQIDNKQ
jgi:hypothetical protein